MGERGLGQFSIALMYALPMHKSLRILDLVLVVLAFCPGARPALAAPYDLVIEGGRVMDPETGLDATRNVAISQGKIVRISSEPLAGTRLLKAKVSSLRRASSICISTARTTNPAASRPSMASPPPWKWKSALRMSPNS